MSWTAVILAVVVVGGTGIFIGLFLGFAGRKFAVEVDEKEAAVLEALPGNNCGGCGFPGCSGLAAAIAKGEAPVNACPVGGNPVAERIGAIMGVEAEEGRRMVAFVKCVGNKEMANQEYSYYGLQDCTMMKYVQDGGPKACNYGCLGYGSCVDACPFDAIHIVNGIADVDPEKCKACKKCIAVCPQHIIELVPYGQKWLVHCNNHEQGKQVMSECQGGCIGCKICEKACKFDAIHVEGYNAHIDYDKCIGCGACARKCPRKVIRFMDATLPPEILNPPKKKVPPKKDAPKKEEAPKTEEAQTEAPKENE